MNILKLFLPTIAVFLCSLTSSANPISDLNTYKEAAQAAVSEGDLGRAGVLNFKIGLLYQNNFVNYTAAIEQYRIALGYFEAAGLTDYIIKTHLALADILLCDSVNLAIPHITACLTMAKAVAACQQPEGYWTRSMLDAEHAPGPETSGTAFFTYGLLWGINNGYLDKATYAPVVMKAWNYLANVALQPDGSVGYVQPIGEKAIPGQVVDVNSTSNFGVGAFLLASCEMVRYLRAS